MCVPTSPPEPTRNAALVALDPRRWGCDPLHGGWSVRLPRLGSVRIALLGWQHGQDPTGHATAANPLGLLVALQGEVWGMPPEETVPANLLAVLSDTGGSVLVAYREGAGWTYDGWLGFAIAAGSRSGVLVSHMLGVRDGLRGGHGLGWLLKAVQGYEAVRAGHHAAAWTFDPLRGANARLNLEKLGAVCSTLVIDKYGPLRSALYGDAPSDRLVATWILLDPAVATRLAAVHEGTYSGPAAVDVETVAEATLDSGPNANPPQRLRYAIPPDIERLTRDDPAEAARWRREMGRVLGSLLSTERSLPSVSGDPLETTIEQTPGAYVVDGLATISGHDSDRRNFYLLSRRPTEEQVR